MQRSFGIVLALISLIPSVLGAVPLWGQCGGINYTGETTCVSGATCTYVNDWYSQCLPSSSSTTSSTSAASSATATSTAKLNTVAKAAGKKYFGSATDNGELSDSTYTAILNDSGYFGAITPGNSMKWDATEPSRGTFTFTNGDTIANLAKANGQLLRGHTLVWHSQLPSWVSSGGFDNATLLSIVSNHATNVVSHYKGQVYAWDVVNEMFNDDGTYRTSVFYNTTGTSYIATALKAARAADPSAKLYTASLSLLGSLIYTSNDYNIDGTGAKSTAMVNLVKSLQSQGVPIDGIGVQGHLIVGSVPTTIQANLAQFAALGVEVAITELDIRMTLPITDDKLAQQKTDYKNVIAACKAVSGCIGVTIWDFTDKYSWIPSVFSGQGAALPWSDTFVKKPAYDGIVVGFA